MPTFPSGLSTLIAWAIPPCAPTPHAFAMLEAPVIPVPRAVRVAAAAGKLKRATAATSAETRSIQAMGLGLGLMLMSPPPDRCLTRSGVRKRVTVVTPSGAAVAARARLRVAQRRPVRSHRGRACNFAASVMTRYWAAFAGCAGRRTPE